MQPELIRRLAQDERLARHAGFWWGLAEGLFFFIVPDVYISFAALFAVRAGAVSWIASIVGSMVAVCLIYVFSAMPGVEYTRFLTMIPGISHSLIEQVRQTLASRGLPYTPFLVFGGVPLKVYAGLAFSLGLPLGTVLLWTALARIVRLAPSFAGAAVTRLVFRRSIEAHPTLWCVLLGCFWLLFYIFYFIRMSRV
jgi:hypothetical protein